MPREIADLAAQMLRDPARVAVTPVASTQERVDQRVILVDKPAKSALLIEVLRSEVTGQTLVFTRTKHGADKVVKSLHHAGLSAEAIHGNKSQNQRERVLGAFRAGKLRTLIATDIAARGIDVEGISHVINYDLPNIPESYVHRIGRTARAGAAGIAISFCDHEERAYPARHREADPDDHSGDGPPLGTERRPSARETSSPAAGSRPSQNRGGQQHRGGQQQNGGGHQQARGQQQNRGQKQNRGGEQQARGGHRQPPRFGKQQHRNDAGRHEPIRRRPIRAPQRRKSARSPSCATHRGRPTEPVTRPAARAK